MNQIQIRKLTIEEIGRIKEIDATHFIKNAWREVDGKRQLVPINYLDEDYPEGYENHYNGLKDTITSGGVAFGAFNEEGRLIGFVTLNREVFGNQFKYVLLDQMFITLEERNKGLGKKLFYACVEEARNWNVDKIYICAGSSEDTIAFYFKLGCIEALEINKELYESDPRDYQLEFTI